MLYRAALFCTLTMVGAPVLPSAGLPEGADGTPLHPTAVQNERRTPHREGTAESGWVRVYIRDAFVRDAVVRALEGAADSLKGARCQSLLSEFEDHNGRLLKDTLMMLQVPLAQYIRLLVFEDGEARAQCKPHGVLAFTTAGSRVISVCGRTFARSSQRDPAEGRAAIIHEMLHSLGLGENPPKPREITYRVKQLCW